MARVTPKRRKEIEHFVERWENFINEYKGKDGNISSVVLGAAIRIIKELLGETR